MFAASIVSHDWRTSVNSVLIVDDESGIREILARWTSAAGYAIREAPDAETALEEMARQAADVVLCDVEMPGHGGLWLAEQLREQFPTTAIVLATAVDSVPAATSFKPGIVEYLVKPLSRDLVLKAVTHGLTWRAAAIARGPGPAADPDAMARWLDSPGTDD